MSVGSVTVGYAATSNRYAMPAANGPDSGQSIPAGDETSLSPAALQALQPETTESTPPAEHHSSGGGGLFGDVGHFFSGAASTVGNVVSSGAHTVGNFVTHTVPNAAKSVATLPLQLLAGHYDVPAPGLPAYPTLNSAQKQRAMRPGQTVSQPALQDTSGSSHEPVTLIYHGSLSTLQKTLGSQGWAPPGLIPMSTMTLDGKNPVLSLQKNAQLGGLSRDHMRIYDMGNGNYGIAATRDVHPTVNVSTSGVSFGHATDPNLNGERDLAMNDILKADPKAASTWQVVQGVPQSNLDNYQYDGQVYKFSLPQ